MLAGTLVTKAYYISGIVPRGFESVSAEEMADGIDLLNSVFAEINATGEFIPYFSYPQINCVAGQEVYFLANAADIFSATFNIGPVRYEMYHDNLKHYFGAPRVDNINALPFNWFWERVNGGINVYVYFLPSSNDWVFKFKCKTLLSDVTEFTNLSSTYDEYYQQFLLYMLVSYICDYNNKPILANVADKINMYKKIYRDLNAYDYSIKKVATYSITDSLTYAQANIGKGWTTP